MQLTAKMKKSNICGAIALILGAVVILGWHMQNQTLVQILPSFAPMQYNTALCFLLSGIGLLSIVRKKHKIGLISGICVTFISLLTLLQYMFNINFGIDQLFMEHNITTKTSHPGRMAPNTATCFILTGTALIANFALARFKVKNHVLRTLGAIILALSSVAFCGYFVSVEAAYGWANLTRMALHTSIGFIILSYGIISYAWFASTKKTLTSTRWIAVLSAIIITLLSISVWFELTGDQIANSYQASLATIILIGGITLGILFSLTINFALQTKSLAQHFKENKDQLQTIIETVPDGIISLNKRGIITSANHGICNIFGHTENELLKKNIDTIITPQQNNGNEKNSITSLLKQKSLKAEFKATGINKNNKPVLLEIRLQKTKTTDHNIHTVATIKDITESHKNKQRIKLLNEIALKAQDTAKLDDIVKLTLAEICNHVKWPLGHAYIWDQEKKLLQPTKRWHKENNSKAFEDFRHVTEKTTFKTGIGLPGRVHKNKKSAWIKDVSEDKNFPRNKLLKNINLHSAFAFPIFLNNEVRLVLEFFSPNIEKPDPAFIDFLNSLGIQLSRTLERQHAEEERENLINELIQSNRDLERFAYAASHDLKAPLRAIDQLAGWLEEDLGESLKDENKENMQTLRNRVARMKNLLDSLLEYSRAGRNMSNHNNPTLQGNEIAEDITILVNPPQGFSITASNSFKTLKIPKMPIEQVLFNLVNNAIKHHDKTSGKINISVNDNNDHYEFSVSDDGPGIPEELQEKAFEMFQTLKSRDKVEGVGMGLALVKKIVTNQGGNISMTSAKGNGTNITFTWPKANNKKQGTQ